MNLKLDSLLDSDCLTPSQERNVRRFVNYKIRKRYEQYINPNLDDGYLLFTFEINNGNGPRYFHVKGKKISNLKDIMYKSMMYYLISLYSHKVENPKTIEKIKVLLDEGTMVKEKTVFCIKFKEDQIPIVGNYKYIKAQSLFRSLQLVMESK